MGFLAINKPFLFLVTAVVPTLMFLAAIGKLSDWSSFSVSLRSYTLISEYAQSWAGYLVPAMEISCFVLFICRLRVFANVLALILLIAFTGITALHWYNNVEPNCACFGLWQNYLMVEQTSKYFVIRNTILMIIAFTSTIFVIYGSQRNAAVARCSEDTKCSS